LSQLFQSSRIKINSGVILLSEDTFNRKLSLPVDEISGVVEFLALATAKDLPISGVPKLPYWHGKRQSRSVVEECLHAFAKVLGGRFEFFAGVLDQSQPERNAKVRQLLSCVAKNPQIRQDNYCKIRQICLNFDTDKVYRSKMKHVTRAVTSCLSNFFPPNSWPDIGRLTLKSVTVLLQRALPGQRLQRSSKNFSTISPAVQQNHCYRFQSPFIERLLKIFNLSSYGRSSFFHVGNEIVRNLLLGVTKLVHGSQRRYNRIDCVAVSQPFLS